MNSFLEGLAVDRINTLEGGLRKLIAHHEHWCCAPNCGVMAEAKRALADPNS